MKKVMLVFGTRPEAIKMCPLARELCARKGLETLVCVTGQHRFMLDRVLSAFGIMPDFDLDIMKEGQSLFDITGGILARIKPVLESARPDAVLVHGDTSTAHAAALACFYLKIPVCHVEAGLRSYNIESPFPEEFNRRAVSLISAYDFAPTAEAKENLLREGKAESRIYVTGNTAIDALKTTVKQGYAHAELERAKGKKLIILTAHRRENLGAPLHGMLRAVRRIAEEHAGVQVLYPVHMNPEVMRVAREELGSCREVRLTEPLDVPDFHNFLARCHMVLTDSGGIQEEAAYLGKPVLVMRNTTERPEGLKAGGLMLVGTEQESIYKSAKLLLENKNVYEKMARAENPYGDGSASEKIADILEKI